MRKIKIVRGIVATMACALVLGLSAACSAAAVKDTGAAVRSGSYEPTEWSMQQYPDYVRVEEGAVIKDKIPIGEIVYSPLDSLGRAGRVEANVTWEMMNEGTKRERQDMYDMFPSGWTDNRKVTIDLGGGKTYHGYFYNRSHLLAKSLGGKEDLTNLVTGTRMQNVGANDGKGGMAYTETLARDWLKDNPDGSIEYVATPAYVGDELVPRSVFVDMRSSDGTLDIHVEVYNAAAGYSIDYQTGKWERL